MTLGLFNNSIPVVAGDTAKTGIFIGLAIVAVVIILVLSITQKKKK